MRLIGYCDTCHRVRYVRAAGSQLAMAAVRGGVVKGICAECEAKADKERQQRRRG